MKVRVACSALIYRKVRKGGKFELVRVVDICVKLQMWFRFAQVLKLGRGELNKKAVGHVVNLLSNDAQVNELNYVSNRMLSSGPLSFRNWICSPATCTSSGSALWPWPSSRR